MRCWLGQKKRCDERRALGEVMGGKGEGEKCGWIFPTVCSVADEKEQKAFVSYSQSYI